MPTTHSPADSTDSHPGAQSWTYWAGRFAVLTAALTVAYVLTIQLEIPWVALGTAEPYTEPLAPMLAISVILAVVTAVLALPTYRYAVGRCSIRGVDLTVPILYLIAPIVFTLALLAYTVAVGDGIPSQSLSEHIEEFGEFFAVWYAGTLLPALAVAAVYASWRRRVSMTLPRAVALTLVVLLVIGGGPVAATEVGLTDDDAAEQGSGVSHDYHAEPGEFTPARGALACDDWQMIDPEFATHNHSLPEYDVAAVHEVREDIWVAPRLEVNETSGETTQDGWYFEVRIDGEVPADADVIRTSVYDSSPNSGLPFLRNDGRNWMYFEGDVEHSVAWDVITDDGEVHRYVTRLCSPE